MSRSDVERRGVAFLDEHDVDGERLLHDLGLMAIDALSLSEQL